MKITFFAKYAEMERRKEKHLVHERVHSAGGGGVRETWFDSVSQSFLA